jgi:hypothetical protein
VIFICTIFQTLPKEHTPPLRSFCLNTYLAHLFGYDCFNSYSLFFNVFIGTRIRVVRSKAHFRHLIHLLCSPISSSSLGSQYGDSHCHPIFVGVFACASLTSGGGSLSDMWDAQSRVAAVALYLTCVFYGALPGVHYLWIVRIFL